MFDCEKVLKDYQTITVVLKLWWSVASFQDPQTPVTPQRLSEDQKKKKKKKTVRHLKHLGPLSIRYLTNIYNIAFNTNMILPLWKHSTIIPISKPNKDHNIGTNY